MKIKELIIGSKFLGHDSSIFVIIPEKKDVFALQTERMTRYKHDKIFPITAIERLISYHGIEVEWVEKITFCNSFLELEQLSLPEDIYTEAVLLRKHFDAQFKKDVDATIDTYQSSSVFRKLISLCHSRHGIALLRTKALRVLGITKKKPLRDIEYAYLKKYFPNAQIDIRFYEHEYCHAVCSYLTSPFEDAILLTNDSWGDGHFSHAYVAEKSKLRRLAVSPQNEQKFIIIDEHSGRKIHASIGGIYTLFTEVLGFTPEADEGKVEALAAYGKPIEDLLSECLSLVTISSDSSIQIDTHAAAQVLNVSKLQSILASHSRESMASTVQTFLEETTRQYIPKIFALTPIRNIALSGGVAANVINNLMIYETLTEHIHITPAMADDGSSQGAAYAYILESGMETGWLKEKTMPYFSSSYSKNEISQALSKYPEIQVEDLGNDWPEKVAELIAEGKIGALFHGKMEWGPRALGNRSIVADTRKKDFRDIINKQIKNRPVFQPFCPSMLAEEKDRLFEQAYLNKHMTCAFRLKKEFWDLLPSAIHVDGTARVQFVEEKDNPNYFRLLKHLKKLTGYGVVINTSFNKHGRTIVESPHDAIRDFLDTDLSYILLEGLLVTKR